MLWRASRYGLLPRIVGVVAELMANFMSMYLSLVDITVVIV